MPMCSPQPKTWPTRDRRRASLRLAACWPRTGRLVTGTQQPLRPRIKEVLDSSRPEDAATGHAGARAW
jgi:hypothetical protein